jgi:hypothetical protein
MFATNSLLCAGGMTQPFTFQGLSSFFLEHFWQLHVKYFLRSLIQPFYLQAVAMTIW